MRARLLPLTLLLCAAVFGPARTAAADDGAMLVRKPVAPIAGAPYWYKLEVEATPRKPRSAALVILGAIIGSLGAAGAVTGSVLLSTSTGSCPHILDKNGEPRRDERDPHIYLCDGNDPQQTIGMATLLAGGGAAAVGLTALLVGIQPKAEDESARRRFVPTVAVGPTGGTITFRF